MEKNSSLTSGGSYWNLSTWNYLEFDRENSEDNYEFSGAEKRALNTHIQLDTIVLQRENPRVFTSLRIKSYSGTWVQCTTILYQHRTTDEYK